MSEQLAKKEMICRNCTWWKHETAGKKLCQKSAPRFSCRDFASKDVPKMCANCKYFNNFEECDSIEPDNVCMQWESVQELVKEQSTALAVVPNKDEVRQMLREGQHPLAISQQLGVQLSTLETPLHVEDNQIKILKHHLNTVFVVLPAVELKARTEPGQSSVSALTSLLAASRDIMSEINNRQDPGEQYARLVAEIMEPLTTAFLEVMTRNISEMKNKTREMTMRDQLGAHEQTINLILKSMGGDLQAALENHLKKLREIIGVVE